MLLCKKRWVKEAHKRGPFRNSYQFSPLFPAYLWWLSRHSLLWSLFQKKCIKSKIKTWKGRYKLHPECLKSPKNLRGTLSLVRLPHYWNSHAHFSKRSFLPKKFIYESKLPFWRREWVKQIFGLEIRRIWLHCSVSVMTKINSYIEVINTALISTYECSIAEDLCHGVVCQRENREATRGIAKK